MWKWKNEFWLNARYAAVGLLNSLVGFAVILIAGNFGFSPLVANFFGYLAGLVIGFLSSRNYVFRSEGKVSEESIRYFLSFGLSYAVNQFVLYALTQFAKLGNTVSQGLAVASYILTMYLLSRLLVFRK